MTEEEIKKKAEKHCNEVLCNAHEKCNEVIKCRDWRSRRAGFFCGYEQALKDLEKENTELKSENQKWKDEWQEQVQKATDEGYARTLQTIQLTKAKDIIKNLMVYVPVDLKEYEEAKQFLSEVEK